MLYHLLLQIVSTQLTSVASPSKPHFQRYDFSLEGRKDVEKAVNDLSLSASRGSLYVIVDEVADSHSFQSFCDELLTQVPRLHLWAASCFHGYASVGLHVQYLTRPLRCPSAVVREVQQDVAITEGRQIKPYSERGVADQTDGPPVVRLYHRGQSHLSHWPGDCVTCGLEVASFLHSLRVPVNSTTSTTMNSNAPPACLEWRDVLVLCWYSEVSEKSDVMTGLREAGIPVRIMTDDDTDDVARARSDVVWVVPGNRVRGLERKVVVCLEPADWYPVRLFFMSRCTSQLVIVSR